MTGTFFTADESETLGLARAFAETLGPGSVVALTGELGTGKTVFARGIAGYLGVSRTVTSPTFTLINEYGGGIPLYHMDLYRLNNRREMEDIGIEDYLYGDGIWLVEWAEKLENLMPRGAVRIFFRQISGDRREIVIERPDEQ